MVALYDGARLLEFTSFCRSSRFSHIVVRGRGGSSKRVKNPVAKPRNYESVSGNIPDSKNGKLISENSDFLLRRQIPSSVRGEELSGGGRASVKLPKH